MYKEYYVRSIIMTLFIGIPTLLLMMLGVVLVDNNEFLGLICLLISGLFIFFSLLIYIERGERNLDKEKQASMEK